MNARHRKTQLVLREANLLSVFPIIEEFSHPSDFPYDKFDDVTFRKPGCENSNRNFVAPFVWRDRDYSPRGDVLDILLSILW
jgi:hypothetical protein